MSSQLIIFYALSVFVIGTALLAVTTSKVFRAAIWLLFCMIGIAGVYFLLNVNFIAALQIAVYVGGIVVLIIFSVFLTQQSGKKMAAPSSPKIIAAFSAVLCAALLIIHIVFHTQYQIALNPSFQPEVQQIGYQMLSVNQYGYLLPFELISFLLLAAMIGCIVIAMKPNTQTHA